MTGKQVCYMLGYTCTTWDTSSYMWVGWIQGWWLDSSCHRIKYN